MVSGSVEATPGLEPGIKVLQTSALPLGYVAQRQHIITHIRAIWYEKKPKIRLAGENLAGVNDERKLKARDKSFIAGFRWLGRQDSNLRMTESESVALPLGDAPVLGWVMGFEPTHAWTTTMCLNHLTTPTILLVCFP